jgi:hypothetical protein
MNYNESKEFARELVEMMKKGALSLEQVKELVPITKEFLKNFSEVLKEEIKHSYESHKESIDALSKAIEILGDMGKQDCSESVKLEIVKKIHEISIMISDLQNKYQNNVNNRTMYIVGIVGVVMSAIVLWTSNSNKNYNEIPPTSIPKL